MAPKAKAVKTKSTPAAALGTPPAPFKKPAAVLRPFIENLSQNHIYITHIDSKPKDFKRKIFLVPVGMNIVVAALFFLRMYYILPYYFKFVQSAFGYPNETTFSIPDSTWSALLWEIGKRGFSLMLDLMLFIFVWPWPVEFVFGQTYGNPVSWRWSVGFRDKEIYVRRSREWDQQLGDIFKEKEKNQALQSLVRQATSPLFLQEKTGYLTMTGQWDLDWDCMVLAHALVDKKDIALDAFKCLVLVHHEDYGWMCLDQAGGNVKEDDRRRQVFAFRDALSAIGKEDLFFRWIEIVQLESSQPGGFGPEKQIEVAKKIRDLFQEQGVDFDKLWHDSVGTDELAGM
ncbi:uncharacterized protein CTRU02_206086 [Colletotrichum truncatum]|uniref:Uncharacterized protein n=1 Tax=Colletotrichum truncatum TaxID=5467 RepID=A0ACC3Z5U4_COLTU|nr:uncharacterized protein CTRU02_10502 [Colletotrichum truncatum]KAF6787238.1 hypothetical protein CTRU02_10502 [Colletotrichum truncatum]